MAHVKMIDRVDEHLAWRAKRPKPGDLSTCGSVLRRFAKSWDETRRSPRSIDPVWIEEWLLDLTVAPGTLYVYECFIKGFLTWAENRSIVQAGSWGWDQLGDSAANRHKPFLWLPASFFQEAIVKQEDWYFRGLLATLVWTCGRGVELRARRIQDVRLDDGLIFWPRTKTHDYDDFLPVTEELDDELRRYLFRYRQAVGGDLKDGHYLFPRYHRSGWSKASQPHPDEKRYHLAETVRRLLEPHIDPKLLEADPDLLKGEGGHTIRRSMARNWYELLTSEGTTDAIDIVKAMLGHKNRAMTEVYIGLDSGRQRRNAAIKGRAFFKGGGASVVDLTARIEQKETHGG